jgi:hypothetical protein
VSECELYGCELGVVGWLVGWLVGRSVHVMNGFVGRSRRSAFAAFFRLKTNTYPNPCRNAWGGATTLLLLLLLLLLLQKKSHGSQRSDPCKLPYGTVCMYGERESEQTFDSLRNVGQCCECEGISIGTYGNRNQKENEYSAFQEMHIYTSSK